MKKPIIRWAGSKRKLIPILLDNLPVKINTYYEPFCGSASLFFELNLESAVLSDINEELITTLKIVKHDIGFYDELYKLPRSKEEYLLQRGKCVAGLSDRERAIRFLYLNRFCFNGVYRTNKNGGFNVPYGKRTGDFPSYSSFLAAQQQLHIAEILVSDYKSALEQVKQNDFVYLDPPYSKSGRFTGEYGVGSFNESGINDLIQVLKNIDKVGAHFLLSYKATDSMIDVLSDQFCVMEIDVARHIAGFKTKWSNSKEILVRNYER